MSTITAYEIEDIGIDHIQYFSGRSTYNTDWANVYIGTGVDPLDAYDQAIAEAYEDDWDVDEINLKERALYHYATELAGGHVERGRSFYFASNFTVEDMHAKDCPFLNDEDGECDGCELMYYIAIYVR